MRGESASEMIVALSAEWEALCSLKPIYEAEKDALVHNKPEMLVEFSLSKAQALTNLRETINARENVFTKAGIISGSGNAEAFFATTRDTSAQKLWQDIRAMKSSLSVLHRVIANLLKNRQTTVERALAVLTASRYGKGLYDQSGSPLSITHSRSGIAI